MKIPGYIIIFFGMMSKTYGLDCYDCDITNFNGESTESLVCLNPVDTGNTTTATKTCPADANGVINYCFTKVIIYDGVVTALQRNCAASDTDEDINTAGAAPAADKCISSLQNFANPADTTHCYFHCTTDKCNTKTTTALKQCSSVCNNGGSCNYITGNCQCANGYSGSDCTTAPTAQRHCVQCNSATDSNCASSTTSVSCPGTEQYCSTATTTILQSGVVVGTPITTRGCTATLKAVDECSFTHIYTDSPISDLPPGYKEYTCISTCETDGCNTNTADGMITGNEATLKCVVCSDSWGGGFCNPTAAFARTACPSSSTYCTSTVTYLISMNDEGVDAYQLESVERGCASSTATETSSCTETDVITGLKKVTCTETCQEDGCNNRWPTRPTCITCTSWNADFADGYNACLENPPQAEVCTYPYEAYCVLQHTGIEKGSLKQMGVKGYSHTISRLCAFKDIGTGCSSERLRETDVESCNRTCTEDGCNVGSGSPMIFQTVFLPTVLGWIAQMHF